MYMYVTYKHVMWGQVKDLQCTVKLYLISQKCFNYKYCATVKLMLTLSKLHFVFGEKLSVPYMDIRNVRRIYVQ